MPGVFPILEHNSATELTLILRNGMKKAYIVQILNFRNGVEKKCIELQINDEYESFSVH